MKHPTFPTIIEDCRQIKISDLKQFGYLEDNNIKYGSLQWGKENSITILVDTCKCEMRLQYTYRQNYEMNYIVPLSCRPSNLGLGVVWYFLCPKTTCLCRKLYLYKGYFVSRHAIPNAMYQQQTESKKMRCFNVIGVILREQYKLKKYTKLYYRNKATSQLRKYERRKKQIQKGWQILIQSL
jgi:hypothetical protein